MAEDVADRWEVATKCWASSSCEAVGVWGVNDYDSLTRELDTWICSIYARSP